MGAAVLFNGSRQWSTNCEQDDTRQQHAMTQPPSVQGPRRHDVACIRSAWPDASGGTPAAGAVRDGVSDLDKPTVRRSRT